MNPHFDELKLILEKLQPNYFPETFPRFSWGKDAFFGSLSGRKGGTILDVGCGNNSPYYTKNALPNWRYIGIDVGDYNQSAENLSDEYILTTSDAFAGEIEKYKNAVDVVISSHNLEHCENPSRVLASIADALVLGGRLYLSFPTEGSVNFSDSREGCLNYYDDCTHLFSPPSFSVVVSALYERGIAVEYATTNYQNPLKWLKGLCNEVESKKNAKTLEGTWEFYGFETIIWGCKK